MEFNEKIQELRKQKGLTQEELAQALYVSRTAISKWESGRGYPNIDSLKTISEFFSVTVDELLSNNQLLTIAEEDSKQKENHFRNLVFGLLDVSFALFLFLPFFSEKSNGVINAVSLLSSNEMSPYLRISYFAFVIGVVILGILTLTLQNFDGAFWQKNKNRISLILNTTGILLFIITQQPYAATFSFVFLIIKAFPLLKRR